jgi:hypothetical protein
VVEGTPLLREHAVKNCIEGSNPSVSAKKTKTTLVVVFCFFVDAKEMRVLGFD